MSLPASVVLSNNSLQPKGASRRLTHMARLLLLTGAATMLQGCLAKAAWDVATLPVRAAGKAVDVATTSQSEADENRGREIRRREERLGSLQRRYERLLDQCERGDAKACAEARTVYAEINALLPTVPLERD